MSELTSGRARELLSYEPETGKLYWRERAGNGQIPAGTEAGSVNGRPGNRYRRVWIGGHQYHAHRLAWLIVTGAWPTDEIDHIDGNGLNNRWRNLRAVQRTGNNRNARRRTDNTSGVTGINWHKASSKWRAEIWVNETHVYLGLFDTLPAAVTARKAAERRYGFHANHGKVA